MTFYSLNLTSKWSESHTSYELCSLSEIIIYNFSILNDIINMNFKDGDIVLDINFNQIIEMIEKRKNNAYRKVNEEMILLYLEVGKFL